MAIPGVQGVAVGPVADQLGVVVLLSSDTVPEALKPVLAEGLNGVPVGIQVVGELKAV